MSDSYKIIGFFSNTFVTSAIKMNPWVADHVIPYGEPNNFSTSQVFHILRDVKFHCLLFFQNSPQLVSILGPMNPIHTLSKHIYVVKLIFHRQTFIQYSCAK